MSINWYVLSLRDIRRSPSYCCVVEFEEVIIRSLGAVLIKPVNLDDLKLERGGERILILVCISTNDLFKLLNFAQRIIKKFDHIYAYVFDSILTNSDLSKPEWKKNISKYSRTIRNVSRIFVPMTYAVTEFESCFNVPVSYIPLASDVSKFGGFDKQKFIDVNGYGRQDRELSKSLSEEFNQTDNKRIYYHTDHLIVSSINDFYAHRRFFWKILRKSKIALAFDPMAANNNNRFRFSFVGQRWFESAAAGCAIIGKKPTCPEMENLFSWNNSTVELPNNREEWMHFLEMLLNDENQLNKIGLRNYICSLTKHDWRHRLLDILKILDILPPRLLVEDIKTLDNRAAQLESSEKF